MKYTAVSVRQLDRKGKPWQARAKYKDVYGKWKEVSKMLPDAKGKKEANKMAKEWLEQLNAEADLMPNAGKAKTVDEISKEYLQHQVSTGEIERSTYSNSLYSYNKYIKPYARLLRMAKAPLNLSCLAAVNYGVLKCETVRKT